MDTFYKQHQVNKHAVMFDKLQILCC